MGDERLGPQLPYAHLQLARQRMARRNHENQFIQIDDYGMKLRLLRIVSEHPKLRVMPQDVVWNVASEGALHRDFDHRMQPAKLRQDGKQIKRSELIGRDRELAFM